METLKIEIPNGFEVESFNKESGEIRFKEKPKKVTDRIKTIQDILKDNKWSEESFEEFTDQMHPDERAYILLKLLAKSLNEGWTPDWNNGEWDKWYPWFYMNGGSSGFRFCGSADLSSGSGVGSRLCFKSRDLSDYAAKQFIDLYKQFMTI